MNFKPFSLELNLLLLPPAVVAVVVVAPVMVTRVANEFCVVRAIFSNEKNRAVMNS